MRSSIPLVLLLLVAPLAFFGQTPEPRQRVTPASLPTGELLSEAGPTFRFEHDGVPSPLTLITYGDQRFTDPTNVKSTNPRVRQWLVNQIAAARPAAVILNGDVPLAGDVKNDYTVFQAETQPWRDAGLHVFPALGNHEFHGDARQCLENWWNNFPEMRNRRWYAAQLGSRVYVLATLKASAVDQLRSINVLHSHRGIQRRRLPIERQPRTRNCAHHRAFDRRADRFS